MAIGIDDLDFYEEGMPQNEPPQVQEPPQEPPASQEPPADNHQNNDTPPPGGEQQEPPKGGEEDDIITTLLKEKGIEDPTKIKFEGDNDTTEERAWSDLTRDEQLNILRQSTVEEEDNDLSEDEIELLNTIRKSRLTPKQYLDSYRDSIVQELQTQQEGGTYTVDDLSDEDLFVLDLQARVEDITEDQLQKALESAKQDEDLFKKQMEGIRKEYKNLEDQHRQQEELEAQERQEQQYAQFSNIITNEIDNLSSIAGLDIELDQDDKELLAEFILGRDEAGISNLGKALNDPESLVTMAWYALNGDKMIDDITTMYNESLKKARQEAYNKGLEDGKKGVQQGHVVVTPPNKEEQNQHQDINSIDDLDF